jgi:16S rRNA (uracil1498-N3)-methyltransferase
MNEIPMEHYYTQKENIQNNKLLITGDEAGHLLRVLRKKPGEEIHVTDGEGNLFLCNIISSAKDNIACEIKHKSFNVNEPEIKVILYQSLLKNPDRFEFAIEKSVELGVQAIQPIITEHVINKKSDKTDRWLSISLAAMKQSQRCYLPKVFHPIDFAEAVKNCDSELKLIADTRQTASRGLTDISGQTVEALQYQQPTPSDANASSTPPRRGINSVALFIGPEGGFREEEVELALKNGFKILNLGKRKYRSETAAIAIISKILL